MSTHTENSAWSPDEVDSLENIDKEIQLVSTSTESHSVSNQTNGTGSGGQKNVISEPILETAPRQSDLNSLHSKSFDNLPAIKFHGPYPLQEGNICSGEHLGDSGNHSFTALSNHFSKKPATAVEHKGNHSISNKSAKIRGTPVKKIETSDKEDYLEQINKQLTKELDEKNAILTLLQENYERLLFKYAEAQNRIDELRIKFLADKAEPQTKYSVLNSHIPPFCSEDYSSKPDGKCQKAVVTPFINFNEPHTPPNGNVDPPISRPSSLPLDNGLKFREKDLLKATTPTDSEGLSSIITSMSGHSKILNSLDEENQINKKSNIFKCKKNNFLLQENTASNDPFDKVKNWQNSLPPLEQIETPETTLYNINNAYSSTNTNYKDIISSPKLENDYVYSDESCPLSWREDPYAYKEKSDTKKNKNESRFYSKTTDEGEEFHEGRFPLKREKSPSQSNIPTTSIIQRRQKRPPLLRCSSLPAYDRDSIRSGDCKNGIYIPPLDLNNVTVSDDESYCQQDYYLIKSKAPTSSSFISSREESIDRSIQTPQSFSSCKATISEERAPRQTINKSTSITPDRSRAMDLVFSNRKTSPGFGKDCNECNKCNRCNVCGESISGENRFFESRSNSCECVHKRDACLKETPARRSKPPFKRSVSFGSGTNTPRYCSHDKQTPREYFSGLNEETIDNFDAYANNLKARSQVVIKALTAHVNNS